MSRVRCLLKELFKPYFDAKDCVRDNAYHEEVYGDGDLDCPDSVKCLKSGDSIVVDQTPTSVLNDIPISTHVTKDVGGFCAAKVS